MSWQRHRRHNGFDFERIFGRPDWSERILRVQVDFTIPDDVQDLILSGRCVAFVGSGVSSTCYPSWNQLVVELCQKCGVDASPGRQCEAEELVALAQKAKDADEIAYHEHLVETFARQPDITNPLYSCLLKLPFKAYFTTNYDPLLEVANFTAAERCGIAAFPSLDREWMAQRTIFYLHGRIPLGCTSRTTSIVLSKDEFASAYEDNGELVSFLRPSLTRDPMVFFGASLRERELRNIFDLAARQQETIRRHEETLGRSQGHGPRRFLCLGKSLSADSSGQTGRMVLEDQDEEEARLYAELGIDVVTYPVVDGSHAQLHQALLKMSGLNASQVKVWGDDNDDY